MFVPGWSAFKRVEFQGLGSVGVFVPTAQLRNESRKERLGNVKAAVSYLISFRRVRLAQDIRMHFAYRSRLHLHPQGQTALK